MREIKFRAFNKNNKNMLYSGNELEQFWGDINFCKRQKMPIEIMQYTGLKDKNGKEVYEGDILRVYEETMRTICNWFSENDIRVISKSDYDGNLNWGNISGFIYCKANLEKYCEVVGNVYENPELLEIK